MTTPAPTPPLAQTAAQLTHGGRGILAADESTRTMTQRLEAEGIASTDTTRRDYRELLLTAPGLAETVSGIILSDETFGQQLSDDRPFPDAARASGVLPGIKVDTGTFPLPGQGGALITEGLDGLGDRLADYSARGAAFAKWRAVFDVATVNDYAVQANGHALARYAALCQEHAIVPIVEPELLCSGDHDLATSARASALALSALFDQLGQAGVDLTGLVLKPSFVTPGLDAAKAAPADVAAATYEVLRDNVPADVAGIAFLSGGHPTEDACAFLGALKDLGDRPWDVTFSFGRALVSAPLHTWAGDTDKVVAAQQQLLDNCARAAAAAR